MKKFGLSDNFCVILRHDMNYTLNIHGKLVDLSVPCVMGILNVTPDSFFEDSRKQTEQQIAERAQQIIAEGGSMIDIGAFSTRPGAQPVDEAEEMARMRFALTVVKREIPDSIVSIDTFRPNVARMAIEEYGADIINDVSEGGVTGIVNVALQPSGSTIPPMFKMVAHLQVPYILMSVHPDLRTTLLAFAEKVQLLRDLGQKDIILDPGFGFGKTLEQNYQLLGEMEKLQVMGLPVLAGLSRKSMLYKLLGGTPADALNATTVVNTIALTKGASILRVHDVKAAVECVKVFNATNHTT